MVRVLGDIGLLMLVVIATAAVMLVIIDHQSAKSVVANPRKNGIIKFENKNYAEHLVSYESSLSPF